MRIHHGGELELFPGRVYHNGRKSIVDMVDIETFSIHKLDDMVQNLDVGLHSLCSDDDVRYLSKFIAEHKVIEVYKEYVVSKVGTYFKPYQAMGLVLNEIE